MACPLPHLPQSCTSSKALGMGLSVHPHLGLPVELGPRAPLLLLVWLALGTPCTEVWNKHVGRLPGPVPGPQVPRSPPTKEEGGSGAGYLPAWAQLSPEVPAQWQPDWPKSTHEACGSCSWRWASLTPRDLGTPPSPWQSAGITPINHPFVRAHGAGWSHRAGYSGNRSTALHNVVIYGRRRCNCVYDFVLVL